MFIIRVWNTVSQLSSSTLWRQNQQELGRRADTDGELGSEIREWKPQWLTRQMCGRLWGGRSTSRTLCDTRPHRSKSVPVTRRGGI